MLAFSRKTASVSVSEFNSVEFLDDLGRGGLEPVIHNFKKGILDKLGLAPDPSLDKFLGKPTGSNLLVGEVFFPEPGVCCYLKVTCNTQTEGLSDISEPDEDDPFADPGAISNKLANGLTVELGEFSPMGGQEGEHLEKLCAAIEGYVDTDFDWKNVRAPGQKVRGTSIVTPSERDIELAGILRDPRLTDLLSILKQKDSIVVDEFLENSEQAEELEYFIDKLFEAEFLAEEIVVYDDDTNLPIIRAKDRASLKQLALAGIKSPTGKPIEDLNAKRIAVLNKENAYKVNPSWVAQIFLANILFKVGQTNKDIQVLESVPQGSLVFSNFDGNAVLFYVADEVPNEELTDSCFNALNQLKEAHIVVFSEAEIGQEFMDAMTDHQSVTGVSFLPSLDTMNADMAQVLEQLRNSVASKVLEEINPMTGVDIAGLVMARLK